jgi:hypothetical protein
MDASTPGRNAIKCACAAQVAPDNPPPVDAPLPPEGEFGRTLLTLREAIVASGELPLTWEELEREIAERRGECD